MNVKLFGVHNGVGMFKVRSTAPDLLQEFKNEILSRKSYDLVEYSKGDLDLLSKDIGIGFDSLLLKDIYRKIGVEWDANFTELWWPCFFRCRRL